MDGTTNGPMTAVTLAKERLLELGLRPNPLGLLVTSPAFLGAAAAVVGSLAAGAALHARRPSARGVLARCASIAAPLLLRHFLSGIGGQEPAPVRDGGVHGEAPALAPDASPAARA